MQVYRLDQSRPPVVWTSIYKKFMRDLNMHTSDSLSRFGLRRAYYFAIASYSAALTYSHDPED